jgi:quercetin dioxygenase-like cupin family protein
MDRFYYPPGGHTHWHIHTGEQVLYGESGRGWVRFQGRERVVIEPGAVVHVPVGLRHWHGARPDTALVHVAGVRNEQVGVLAILGGGLDLTGDGDIEPHRHHAVTVPRRQR